MMKTPTKEKIERNQQIAGTIEARRELARQVLLIGREFQRSSKRLAEAVIATAELELTPESNQP